MNNKFFNRLTPTVPGEAGVFHIPSQGRVVTGFVSGGRTEGAGFPQWAKSLFSDGRTTHYFESAGREGVMSKCGRIVVPADCTLLPGNYPRCKDCEKRYTKMLRNK